MSSSPPSPSRKLGSSSETSKASPTTHAYAIKSSASAILTRNNSVSNSPSHHHYVPLLNSVDPIKRAHRKRSYVVSKKLKKIEAADEASVPDGDSVLIPTPPISVRVKRRDTLPSSFLDSNKPGPDDVMKDLPTNPKQWTPLQLATYLSSVLKLRDGAMVPPPVMRDVTAFIVRERLDGRTFLKMTREDYDAYNINLLWKEALGNASITLRQSLLQEQVFGSLRGSALSADDLHMLRGTEKDNHLTASPITPGAYVPWDGRRTLGRLQAGRVKGMAHKFERSHSEGETVRLHTGEEGDLAEKSESDSDDMSSIVESPVERDDIHPFAEDAEVTNSPLPSDETLPYEEEPTVDELVRDEDQPSIPWGARAWEDEERNVTARKITQEDGSAEEILSGVVDKKHPLPESLASLFSGPVSETHDSRVESSDGITEDTKGRTIENPENESAPPSPIPPFLEACSDIEVSIHGIQSPSIPSPSLGPSSGFLYTSSNPSDVSLVPTEGSVASAVQEEAKSLKTDASAMTENIESNTESIQSLREILQILRDRVAVVEKRIVELETQDTRKEYHTHGNMEQTRPVEESVKPNDIYSLDQATTFAIRPTSRPTSRPASRPYTRTDVVGENIDRHKTPNNYASSDLNIYSYVFYASIGLAAMVLDRTIFGRGRSS